MISTYQHRRWEHNGGRVYYELNVQRFVCRRAFVMPRPSGATFGRGKPVCHSPVYRRIFGPSVQHRVEYASAYSGNTLSVPRAVLADADMECRGASDERWALYPLGGSQEYGDGTRAHLSGLRV